MFRSFQRLSATHFDTEGRLLERAKMVLTNAQVVEKLTSYFEVGAADISIPLAKGVDSNRLAKVLERIVHSNYHPDIASRIEFKPWEAAEQLGPHINVIVKVNSSIQDRLKEAEARKVLLDIVLFHVIGGAGQYIDLNYMFCDAYRRNFFRT